MKVYGSLLNEYLAELFPDSILITACGGGAKELEYINYFNFKEVIYNEISPVISELFSVVSDKRLNSELQQILKSVLDMRGFTKAEYKKACRYLKKGSDSCFDRSNDKDRLTLAYYGFLIGNFSFNGNENKFNMQEPSKMSDKEWEHYIGSIRNKINHLDMFYYKYRKIRVMNKDIIEILEEYRTRKDVILFIDPPYLADNKKSNKDYQNDVQHNKMVELLNKSDTQAKIIICGTNTKRTLYTYKPLTDNGWHRIYVESITKTSSTKRTSQKEYIWTNINIHSCVVHNIFRKQIPNLHRPSNSEAKYYKFTKNYKI